MPQRAAEHGSGSRGSPLPGLSVPQPCLRSNVPGLCTPLPGLLSDLLGLSAPLPGLRVPPSQGQDGLPPRGQDGHPLICVFPGLNVGVQVGALEPHFTTAVHKTTLALASPAARSSPLGARPAGLLPSRARTAMPASENAVQDFFVWLRRGLR